MRVIFLTEQPFTRLMARFTDLSALRSVGIHCEIWDAGDLNLPELRGRYGELAHDQDLKLISQTEELLDLSSSLTEEDVIIFDGASDAQLSKHENAYQIISRSKAKLCGVSTGLTRQQLTPSEDKGYFVIRVRRFLVDLINHPIEGLAKVSKRLKITQRFYPSIRPAVSASSKNVRPLDYLWVGHSHEYFSNSVISPATHIRYIHTMDFDRIYQQDIRPATQCDFLVYLDCMGPSHPDSSLPGNEKFAYWMSQSTYDSTVSRGLESLAMKTGLQVVVAAHPRTTKGTLDGRYGDFPVIYEETDRLISTSRAVIDFSYSIAVGMAVVARRPVIFLKSRKIPAYARRGQSDVARWLRLPRTNIEKIPDKFVIPNVYEYNYAKYTELFLKRPNSLEGPFWNQIASDIVSGFPEGRANKC